MSQARREPNDVRSTSPASAATTTREGRVLPPSRLRVGDTALADPEETLSSDEQTPSPREEGAKLPVVDPKSYRITGEVAQGGIGRILRARDERLDRPVALKELLTNAGLAAEDRFVREALLTARLQHPSIVPLYEAGRWPTGEPFYAMKYVSGRSLADVILESRTPAQRLGLLPHVLAVAEAMAYAHSERIIHRDLKPANVLVGAFGETVVIDWGLAKDLAEGVRDSSGPDAAKEVPEEEPLPASHTGLTPRPPASALTMQGAVMGTPAYMPLEQATGERVDERADVYALGAILYHLLAGACPYEGDTSIAILRKVIAGPPPPIEARQKGIPQDLLTIVKKAMAREPSDRYPSAKELADDLRRFQTGKIVGAHKYSRLERIRRFARRHRAAVSVGALASVVLVIAGVIAAHHTVEQRERAEAGEAAALVAQKEAVEHADDLTLVQARAAVERDPNEALAWLKSLSPSFKRWPEARLIAADAEAQGVATVLRGHEGAVNDVLFSPDSKLLATVSDDHTARLWDVQTGKSRVLAKHVDEVWMSRFSPSGKVLATTSKDKTIRLWGAATGEPLGVLTGHTASVSNVLFCDEDTLLSSGLDRVVWRWDLRTGKGRILRERASLRGLALAPDRRRAALLGEDGLLYLYDVERDQLQTVAGDPPTLIAVNFSPDSKAVFGRGRDGSVRRWDLATGKAQIVVDPPSRGTLPDVRSAFMLSPDGKQIAMSGDETIVRLWDLTTGTGRVFADHQGSINSLVFSPDGALLVAGSRDHMVHLWDLVRGVSAVLRGFEDSVGTIAFSPDGKLLAAGSVDHTVRIFALRAPSHQIVLDHGSALRALAFSPDGERLVAGGKDGKARLIHLASREITLLEGHTGSIRHATFSPNGDLIASTDTEWITRVWDLTGHEIWAVEGAAERRVPNPSSSDLRLMTRPNQAIFSPDGRLLAVPGKANTVQVFDVDTGSQRALTGHAQPVRPLAFSPDGRLLASGSNDGVILLWELDRGESRVFSGHEGRVGALAFSPDGRVLASGSDDHSLRLWDIATGVARSFAAGGHGIVQIAFSGDSASVITRDADATGLRLWDAATGEPRGLLRGHAGLLSHFALSPDDLRIATASLDGTARVWDVESGESRVLSGHNGAVWATAFSPDGKLIASAGDDGTVRLWADDLPEDGPALRAWIGAATPDTIGLYHHSARAGAKQATAR